MSINSISYKDISSSIPLPLRIEREVGILNHQPILTYYIEDLDYGEDVTINHRPFRIISLPEHLQPSISHHKLHVQREILTIDHRPVFRYYIEDHLYYEDITFDHRPVRPFCLPDRLLPIQRNRSILASDQESAHQSVSGLCVPDQSPPTPMEAEEIRRSIRAIYSHALETPAAHASSPRVEKLEPLTTSDSALLMPLFCVTAICSTIYLIYMMVKQHLEARADARNYIRHLRQVEYRRSEANEGRQAGDIFLPHPEPDPADGTARGTYNAPPTSTWSDALWESLCRLWEVMYEVKTVVWAVAAGLFHFNWYLTATVLSVIFAILSAVCEFLGSRWQRFVIGCQDIWYSGHRYQLQGLLSRIFNWKVWTIVMIVLSCYHIHWGPGSTRARLAEDIRRAQPWDPNDYTTSYPSRSPYIPWSTESKASFRAAEPVTTSSSLPVTIVTSDETAWSSAKTMFSKVTEPWRPKETVGLLSVEAGPTVASCRAIPGRASEVPTAKVTTLEEGTQEYCTVCRQKHCCEIHR